MPGSGDQSAERAETRVVPVDPALAHLPAERLAVTIRFASSGEAVEFVHREPAARPHSQAGGNTRASTFVTKLRACPAAII
jgi:hypothetical protein